MSTVDEEICVLATVATTDNVVKGFIAWEAIVLVESSRCAAVLLTTKGGE